MLYILIFERTTFNNKIILGELTYIMMYINIGINNMLHCSYIPNGNKRVLM